MDEDSLSDPMVIAQVKNKKTGQWERRDQTETIWYVVCLEAC